MLSEQVGMLFLLAVLMCVRVMREVRVGRKNGVRLTVIRVVLSDLLFDPSFYFLFYFYLMSASSQSKCVAGKSGFSYYCSVLLDGYFGVVGLELETNIDSYVK